jgi:hypothetical protein
MYNNQRCGPVLLAWIVFQVFSCRVVGVVLSLS